MTNLTASERYRLDLGIALKLHKLTKEKMSKLISHEYGEDIPDIKQINICKAALLNIKDNIMDIETMIENIDDNMKKYSNSLLTEKEKHRLDLQRGLNFHELIKKACLDHAFGEEEIPSIEIMKFKKGLLEISEKAINDIEKMMEENKQSD